ncbi:threonine/serine ThrE exporter family protein [Peptoniphilus catoniae]|uniref:threonine/serine ThrE exporter family protein n=1 Tax=Peptoniphilus catoniae TaxID=1660341 RepID=UPI001FEA456C|nr:threonine/serine exporter family protein [Peptoniphilus catoniae]
MNLALYAGTLQIISGAEIYRAENTIERICESCVNIRNIETFVLPSAVFLSVEYQGKTLSSFRKVPPSSINLENIDRINTFSRNFVDGKYSIDNSIAMLNEIRDFNKNNIIKNIIASGCAGSFFCLVFGGTAKDFLPAFIITAIMSIAVKSLKVFKFSFVVDNFIGAFIVSFLAIFFNRFNFGQNVASIIIGAIMILLPGFIFTNSIRDIMSEDYLSGLIGLTKAIFIAFFIAMGVGSALKILR